MTPESFTSASIVDLLPNEPTILHGSFLTGSIDTQIDGIDSMAEGINEMAQQLADATAFVPNLEMVYVYPVYRLARNRFLSWLDGFKLRGEPIEWSERKGIFRSLFTVRAPSSVHDEMDSLITAYDAELG